MQFLPIILIAFYYLTTYLCASFLQSEVVERHFHDLVQRYGETIALDLTDKVRFSLSLDFHFKPGLSIYICVPIYSLEPFLSKVFENTVLAF